ncbi:MAG: PAS domain S-box protein [Campylobacterales bacterium]
MRKYIFFIVVFFIVVRAEPIDDIIDNHSSIMLLIDPVSGKIIKANNSASEFYGFSVEELEDMNIQDINTFTKSQIANEMKSADLEDRNYFIFRHRLKSGETTRVEVYSSPIVHQDKTLLLSVIHDIGNINQMKEVIDYYSGSLEGQVDKRTKELLYYHNIFIVLMVFQLAIILFLLYNITKRRKVQKELDILNKELEIKVENSIKKLREKDAVIYEQSKRKALDRLLVDLAHHWRQPLNVASLEIQNIEDFIDECSVKNKNHINDCIQRSLNQIKDLSQTITNFTAFYEKKSTKQISISEGLKEARELSFGAFVSNTINLQTDIDDNFRTTAEAGEWVEFFTTFFINTKEIAEERRLNSVDVFIKAYGDSEDEYIIIEDSAGGIDEALLPDEIFKPYATTSFKTRDKGLGLYMVYSLVTHRLKGTITATNSDKGAKFIIKIKK